MKRLALGLFVILANLGVAKVSLAQEPEGAAAGGGDKAPPADTTPGANLDLDLSEVTGGENPEPKKTTEAAGAPRRSWEDIVVVPRKAFLKKHRVEIAPSAGITLNDPLIRHYSFGGELNYYITDVLSVGLEGQYFIKELSERESLTGLQYYLVPTLNKLKYHYGFDFGYVMGYGKFGLFNKWIVHWDLNATAGVGIMKTEIIPRAFGDASFTNNDIAGQFGLGVRLFVLDWLTLSLTFRDYLYNDKFESSTRTPDQDIATVKQQAQSQFVQNIMMFFSIGLYIPPSFSYRTPR
jgi:outer membrane beta-barrel protein